MPRVFSWKRLLAVLTAGCVRAEDRRSATSRTCS
jgi:hypothetical protein